MLETVSSDLIAAAEIDSSELVSQEFSLKKACGGERSREIKAIFYAAPFLEETTKRLARFITHGYPDVDGGNLLANAIEDATEAYVTSSLASGQYEANEQAYLIALVARASRLVHYVPYAVRSDGTTEAWPRIDAPLIDWAKKKQAERVVFARDSDEQLSYRLPATRLILATRLLTVERSACILSIAGWDGHV